MLSSTPYLLAASAASEYEVSLDSPAVIAGTPLYETDAVFTVTNTSSRDLTGLVAYLSYMDVVDGIGL